MKGCDKMKKVISFDKEILFPTMIGEITAISLDQTLKFLTKNDIEGDFIIEGRYKMTEASAIEEDFKYTIPIEVALTETFTLDTTKIEIQEFNYEIVDEDILKVKITLLIEGVEEVLLEEEKENTRKEDNLNIIESMPEIEKIEESTNIEETSSFKEQEQVRQCDGEEKTKEEKMTDIEPIIPKTKEQPAIATKKEELKEEQAEQQKQVQTDIQSIFRVFNDAEETYKAYTVYIMRKNDSINTILDRYKITKEQLEEYNDLAKIELGSKVIIPTTND